MTEWTLLALGDIALRGRAPGIPLADAGVASVVASADLVIANMEGAVAADAAPIVKSGPVFHVDPEQAEVQAALGISVVSLANNHAMDYGPAGMLRTLDACRRAGTEACGAGADLRAALAPVVREVRGTTVAIIGLCEREFGTAAEGAPGTAWISHPLALDAVSDAARVVDVVVVMAHGGAEEIAIPPEQRVRQLRTLTDAGATIVVGAHPHVVQGSERHGKSLICYSLGDFAFDYAGIGDRTRGWGAMLQARMSGGVVLDATMIPVAFEERRPTRLVTGEQLDRCWDALHRMDEILLDPSTLRRHWQQAALSLWTDRYEQWLATAAGASSARRAAETLVRRIGGGKGGQGIPDSGVATLLNLVRCESHRWAIETAGALLTGDEADERRGDEAATLSSLAAVLLS
jgi:hypothetical protein